MQLFKVLRHNGQQFEQRPFNGCLKTADGLWVCSVPNLVNLPWGTYQIQLRSPWIAEGGPPEMGVIHIQSMPEDLP